MPLVKFARFERTTDATTLAHKNAIFDGDAEKQLSKQKYMDVVLYDDEACSKLYARYGWYQESRPDRRFRWVTLNCYRWRIIWVDTVD